MILRHLDYVLIAKEIWGMQHVDMQGMAFDPFPAIEETSESSHFGINLDSQSPLDRVHRAHLVSDRAYPANSRRDVSSFRAMASAQKRFEHSRRLIDS